jgi:hypothetical protein
MLPQKGERFVLSDIIVQLAVLHQYHVQPVAISPLKGLLIAHNANLVPLTPINISQEVRLVSDVPRAVFHYPDLLHVTVSVKTEPSSLMMVTVFVNQVTSSLIAI